MILLELHHANTDVQKGIVHIANDAHPSNRECEFGERFSTEANYYIRCLGSSMRGAWKRSRAKHPTCLWCISSRMYGPLNLPR